MPRASRCRRWTRWSSKIKVETDPAKRRALVVEFQKLATVEAPILPLVELESMTVASVRVQNHSNDPNYLAAELARHCSREGKVLHNRLGPRSAQDDTVRFPSGCFQPPNMLCASWRHGRFSRYWCCRRGRRRPSGLRLAAGDRSDRAARADELSRASWSRMARPWPAPVTASIAIPRPAARPTPAASRPARRLGNFDSTNLTPDPETGIGAWSEAAFTRALREGVIA